MSRAGNNPPWFSLLVHLQHSTTLVVVMPHCGTTVNMCPFGSMTFCGGRGAWNMPVLFSMTGCYVLCTVHASIQLARYCGMHMTWGEAGFHWCSYCLEGFPESATRACSLVWSFVWVCPPDACIKWEQFCKGGCCTQVISSVCVPYTTTVHSHNNVMVSGGIYRHVLFCSCWNELLSSLGRSQFLDSPTKLFAEVGPAKQSTRSLFEASSA